MSLLGLTPPITKEDDEVTVPAGFGGPECGVTRVWVSELIPHETWVPFPSPVLFIGRGYGPEADRLSHTLRGSDHYGRAP